MDTETAKRIAENEAMARKLAILRSLPGLGQVAAAATLPSDVAFIIKGCLRRVPFVQRDKPGRL